MHVNKGLYSLLQRCAQVLQQVGVDCIDESEVLTVADEAEDDHSSVLYSVRLLPL